MAGNQERRRRPSPDELAGLAGRLLPRPALEGLLAGALRGLGVSLCLHRIAARPRPTDWQPGLSMPAPELDELIELLVAARPARVSITFDDGYRDAAAYIRSRAPRFPEVDFIFFICPEKAELRAGFRWDLVEESQRLSPSPRSGRGSGRGLTEDEAALLAAPVDVLGENDRRDLRKLTESADYELCTVDELKSLWLLPNVQLGNHTNLHLSSAKSPDETVRADFERSTTTFTRLFGAPRHFAFPFGTPRHHFEQRHVDWLRALGDFQIWTTEARPFRPKEVGASAVLPRFPVDGSMDAQTLAGWIAARALDFRARGSRHRFP